MLEWLTSEEAEKQSKTDLLSYYKQMLINVVIGIIAIISNISIYEILLGILWIIIPFIMCEISKEIKRKTPIETINKENKEYLLNIAKTTWQFFETYLNEKHNYLIPDNYQEGRKQKVVSRTSSTNIGLSLLAVISAYDLKFITLEHTVDLLKKILDTIISLEKWNGHLYNWYDTKTKNY